MPVPVLRGVDRRVRKPKKQADPRGPLYLTAAEALNWRSLHTEDADREIIVVESPVKDLPDDWVMGTVPRVALGWNAAGEWVWQDEQEGRWP